LKHNSDDDLLPAIHIERLRSRIDEGLTSLNRGEGMQMTASRLPRDLITTDSTRLSLISSSTYHSNIRSNRYLPSNLPK